jgi:phage terminase large subunit
VNAQFPEKLQFLFQPHRYKCGYGGRGGAKSWNFARALLLHGTGQTYFNRPLRVLCTREIQKSIKDSVHTLLRNQISALGLDGFYKIQETGIKGANGSEFIFAGLKQNIDNLKSYEDVDICWVEEAHTVSRRSWEVLIPTIRKSGSEIWISFNPELETDETYRRFVTNPPPNAEVVKINWRDNPWFPDVLKQEMEHLKAKDADAYENVYEGACKQVVEGAVYRNELIAAEKDGRIMRVPYDSTKPVHTFWDLGFGDLTCIWFAQTIGLEFRLIDYFDGSQQGIGYYLKALQEKPYVYGTHYLPHDARQKQLAAGGRSILDQVQSDGRKVEIIPQLSIEDGIAAARAIFNRCVFDSVKCADGLQALRHYRYETDEKLQTLKRNPLHDWASHGSDAFRGFAVAIEEPARKRKEVERPQVYDFGQENTAWMG